MSEEEALTAACELASSWTGLDKSAISRAAIRRATRGLAPEEVRERSRRREPRLARALGEAAANGETYFFRHSEQLELAASLVSSREGIFRAWCAGCSTGEEAYSLAAWLLLAAEGRPVSVRVLGTDFVERRIAAARRGLYGRWSRRGAETPLLASIVEPAKRGRIRIVSRLRSAVSFAVANLLDPPPIRPGSLHLVLCRNVLIYFEKGAGNRVREHVARALAPGGVAIFGASDAREVPACLVPTGPPELHAFEKIEPLLPPSRREAGGGPGRGASGTTTPARLAPEMTPARTAPALPLPIAIHVSALSSLERGNPAKASRLLAELEEREPDYLPGIFERALLHGRNGERQVALALMRDVLRRAEALPPSELVQGPESLTADFYASSARAFVASEGRQA